MQRVAPADKNGTTRVRCPALNGTVGCPLRPHTVPVAIQLGLPIVQQPPDPARDGEPLPRCCTNDTVSIKLPAKLLKAYQKWYWGGRRWLRMWNRRTFVESSYGIRKNPNGLNVHRGHNQVYGIVWMHIVMGLVNAAYNIKILQSWCAENNDPRLHTHPMLRTGRLEGQIGHVFVTLDEYNDMKAERLDVEAAA
jgi:hypothetical protein